MEKIPCFLCGTLLSVRTDKNGKLYLICDSCGSQHFVRRKQGMERLKEMGRYFQQQTAALAARMARDAMQNGGKLTIHTKNVYQHAGDAQHRGTVPPGSYVGLTVTDTGNGMDENTCSRVFEPYFTTKERGKGTGLGLAVVYDIVDQSGGHVWVESKPGHGTTFTIYLPRVEEVAAPDEPAKVNHEALRGSETILLVEDSNDLRRMTRAFLQMQGYKVMEATNGADAVEVIQQYKAPIHLMLTDVVMPGISGPELAKRAATLRPNMKVLYASGYAGDLRELYGVSASDIPLLEKPFNFDSLGQKMRELLGQEKLQKSA